MRRLGLASRGQLGTTRATRGRRYSREFAEGFPHHQRRHRGSDRNTGGLLTLGHGRRGWCARVPHFRSPYLSAYPQPPTKATRCASHVYLVSSKKIWSKSEIMGDRLIFFTSVANTAQSIHRLFRSSSAIARAVGSRPTAVFPCLLRSSARPGACNACMHADVKEPRLPHSLS